MDLAPEETVRAAFDAFLTRDAAGLARAVHPDLAWTYLDPSLADPKPATCYGRQELEKAAGAFASMGLTAELEELEGIGDHLVVVLHAPGLDRFRARAADDRNFYLVTVGDGQVSAIRACRSRAEARKLAGLS